MTEREVLKLALEALEVNLGTWSAKKKAIPAIKEVLAQPEPVIDKSAAIRIATSLGWTPQRTWVGLTDDERNHARQTVTYSQLAMTAGEWTEKVQIETERRLKEKNT